jgi:hypothetical protein
MNDTPPEVEKLYHDMLMAKSGAERMAMGARMFDVARRMMIASFPPGLSDEDFRVMLFERTYPELDAEAFRRHLKVWREKKRKQGRKV